MSATLDQSTPSLTIAYELVEAQQQQQPEVVKSSMQCENCECHQKRQPQQAQQQQAESEHPGWNFMTANHTPSFPLEQMADILYGPEFSRLERQKVYKIFDQPVLRQPLYTLDKFEARKLVEKQAKLVLQDESLTLSRITQEPIKIVHRITMTGMLNTSLGTKAGVQTGLFGGSILNLGGERHAHLLGPISKLQLAGCFCMTELLHGSNVRGIQTTAIYDATTEEFVIHTPNKGAIKWWIGNAALSGQVGTVFARLITKGKDHGVHAFLVPLRDLKTHELCPGVIIGDCGEKNGLHGVDNGFIAFNQVRIPRENLLNRFGDVLPDGTYTSPITSENRRFASLLGELITGRASLSVNTMNTRRKATCIATRYAHQRRQFGPDADNEVPIISYPSTCVRIMPVIASCYAGEFALRAVLVKFTRLFEPKTEQSAKEKSETLAETHALISGLKAVLTTDTQQSLHVLRECCGGHGYSAYCHIGSLANDNDIMQTYEGDNTVLVQQLGGYLLKKFSKQFKGNLIVDGLNFLKKQIGSAVVQRNPVITRVTVKNHLCSYNYHLTAFEYRTAKLLTDCATSLRANKKKMGEFDAWSSVVPIMLKLGRAYMEQFALEQFVAVIQSTRNAHPEVRKALKIMCKVYALSIMDRNAGEFGDLFRGNKTRAISHVFAENCMLMKDYSLSLVDAFEIPDFLLDAPIGLSNNSYVDNILDYTESKNPTNAEAFRLLSKL